MPTLLLSIIDSAADCPSRNWAFALLHSFIYSFIHPAIQSKYPVNCLHFSVTHTAPPEHREPTAFTPITRLRSISRHG